MPNLKDRKLLWRNNFSLWLLLILLVGLVLRAIWILKVRTLPVSDFLNYHEEAINLIKSRSLQLSGQATAFHAPGYPFLLAIFYMILRPSIWTAKLLNLWFSMGSILSVYLIGQKVFSRKVGLFAAALMAVSARSIIYTSVIGTEQVFTFLLLLIILIELYQEKRKLIYLGLLVGVSALIKPYMIIFPVFLFPYYLFKGNLISAIKQTVLVIFVMLLLISPWTIRNYVNFGNFVPISTSGDVALFINNNDTAKGTWQDPTKIPGTPWKAENLYNDHQAEKKSKAIAQKWILDHPNSFISLGVKRFANTFIARIGGDDSYWAINSLVGGNIFLHPAILSFLVVMEMNVIVIVFLLTLGFTLYDLLKKENPNNFYLLALALLGFFVFNVFVFEGQPRYSFPLIPLTLLLASHFILERFKYKSIMLKS